MSDYTNQEWAEVVEGFIGETELEIETKSVSPTVVISVSGDMEDFAQVLNQSSAELGDVIVKFESEGSDFAMLARTRKTSIERFSEKDTGVLRAFFERRLSEGYEFEFEFDSDGFLSVVTDPSGGILNDFGVMRFSVGCVGMESLEEPKFEYTFAKMDSPQTHIYRERINMLEEELFELPCMNCGSFLDLEERYRPISNPRPVGGQDFVCHVCCTAFPKNGEVHSRVEGDESVSEIEQEYFNWYVEDCLSESESFPSPSERQMVGEKEEFILYEVEEDELTDDGDVEFLLYAGEMAPILKYDLELGFIGDEKFRLDPEFSCPFCQREDTDDDDEDLYRYRVKGFYNSEEYGAMDLGVFICGVCRDEVETVVKDVVNASDRRSEFMARCI